MCAAATVVWIDPVDRHGSWINALFGDWTGKTALVIEGHL